MSLQQLEERLADMGWGRFQTYLFWACGLVTGMQGWGADMMWIMLISIIMNEAADEWSLSEFSLSLYAVSQSAGVFLGSYFWGYMSDKYGRMYSFKKTLFICGIFGLGASLSLDFPMLCTLGFIVGTGIGGDIAVDGTVFIEFCPKDDRHMLTLMSFVVVLGSTFVPALALGLTVLLDDGIWRWAVAIVSVLNIVFGAMRYWCLETPHFYVTHGKLESANVVLKTLASYNKQSFEPIHLDPEEAHHYLLQPSHIGVKRQLKRLFMSNVRMTTVWFILVRNRQIWFFTAFTFSGFGVFMPKFLKEASGSEHSSNEDVYTLMTIQQLAGVISVVGATYSVKSCLGRRWSQAVSLMISSFFMYIFLMPFAYWAVRFMQVVLSSTLFYLFSLMAYSVQYAYTPESFPADIRNTGVGLCSASNRLASIFSPLIAGALLDRQYGSVVAVVLYSISLFVAGLFACMTKETRGANIEADAETLNHEG